MNETDHHYLISDLHLGHANILRHDKRPFTDIKHHDGCMRAACADVMSPGITLWILGDVAAKRADLELLMCDLRGRGGKTVLIRGNHDDKAAWKHRDVFDEAYEARYVRVNNDVKMYLSHYAHRVWRNSHHGAYHFYGHSHGHLPGSGRSMDVGAPCVGYKPICLTECVQRLREQPTSPHHVDT